MKTFLPYCTLLCFIESGHFNVKDLASRNHSGMSQSFFGYFWLPCTEFKFPYVNCPLLQKSELLKYFK